MSKKILIVDDAKSIRQTLGFVLKNEGYEIAEAENGQDALEKLDGSKINLIISDVNMPVMDGITFVKTIKEDETYSNYKFVPVIMLTTESSDDMKAKGKEIGVKAWVTKPFPPESLVDAIQKILV